MTSAVDRALIALRKSRINYTSERELGLAVGRVFSEAGLHYEVEHILSGRSRVDLWLEGGVAVELKVGGSASGVLRQLHRYAGHDTVSEILLVTTLHRHVRSLPATLCGKRVSVFRVTSF